MLTVGAALSGFVFKDIFIGTDHQDFWRTSIFFKDQFILKHPPLWFLLITPLCGLLIIIGAYFLYIKNENILEKFKKLNQPLYNFLLNKWYFDELYDYVFTRPAKAIGSFFWSKGDIKLIDGFGPNGFAKIIKSISERAVLFQSGYLYHYAFVILIGLTILLTYLLI